MDPERWQRIKEVLHSALELAPQDRSAFINNACAGDLELRSDVEVMLASHEQAGDFIESPAYELMADSLNETQSMVGGELGPYRVTGRLGTGGMGEVYLAEDTRLGRKVAIKVLLAHFTRDEERVRRFQQEARAASALNHPNILTIYEIGESNSRQFIVTEVIEGETLRQRLAGAEIEISAIFDIAIQMASALSAAHAAGIIHRDIKPDNVMIRKDGIVKVLDFGLAKLTEVESSGSPPGMLIHTQEGIVMGTVYYMSPEQARGFPVDARADVWSLGVVVYEMISGHLPFDGPTNSDVIASILQRHPATLARTGEIPTELDWIVKKALRKDREERYQTAKDFLSDLKSLQHKLEFQKELELSNDSGPNRTDPNRRSDDMSNQAGQLRSDFEKQVTQRIGLELANRSREQTGKLQAETQSNYSASSQTARSNRAVKIIAVLGAAAVLAVAGYLSRGLFRRAGGTTASKNFTFTQMTYQQGTEVFPSLSPDGKSLAYASRTSGNWDIYVQRVGGANPINLTPNSPADDSQPAFSPDGERIAFRSDRDGGGIYLMGATGESLTRVSDFGYSPSWSPDGTQILVGTEKIPQPSTRPTKSQLWKIDVKSGERRMISEGDALQPHYSPNQRRIVYWSRPSKAGQREDIWTIPADGGEAVRITSGSTIDVNPVWSPDGKYLYFSSSRGGSMNIWRVPVDEVSGSTTGEPEPVTTIGAATSALQLSLSREGHRLAYIAQEDIRNLRKVAFEPSTGKTVGEPQWITRGSLQLWFPNPSPDGEWLTACSRGQQRHVYIIRTDGTELRDLTDDNFRHDGWPRWSPDGKRIAFTSRRTGDYEVWVINRDGSGMRQVTDSKGGHYSPWSPDGNTIAYSIHTPKNDCVIVQPDKQWDGQQLTALPALSDPTLSFEGWAWSTDGKKLAGIKHLPNGLHSGIGVYDQGSGTYDWFTDFGDWPVWLNDNRRVLFVSQGKIFLFDTTTRKHEPVLTVTDQDVDIGSPSLSPDNKTLYFTFVSAEADIWLMSLD